VRSLDDLHYYRERERQCRKAAAEATDPSVRSAHAQLAQFYARRIEAEMVDDAAETAAAKPAS
jgi:glutamyl-tRNA reductase